jgi:hypothetical protein
LTPGSSASGLPFDRIVLAGKTYSVDEFLEIPLSQRVRHILNCEVTFLRAGSPVKASHALAGLRAAMERKGSD